MRHHAYVIEAGQEEGVRAAHELISKELGMDAKANPDVIELRYGLFSVEDARKVNALAGQAPMTGDTKALIIAADRAYHEAQNALLKLFEEPPKDTTLFLILPSVGGLLPTLRSRVSIISPKKKHAIPESAQAFLKTSREKRTAIAKKLASGKDEEERRENREEAIAIVNGIEAAAYAQMGKRGEGRSLAVLLTDISVLRGYLYDRSAPVRMILEHLSLVLPRDLI